MNKRTNVATTVSCTTSASNILCSLCCFMNIYRTNNPPTHLLTAKEWRIVWIIMTLCRETLSLFSQSPPARICGWSLGRPTTFPDANTSWKGQDACGEQACAGPCLVRPKLDRTSPRRTLRGAVGLARRAERARPTRSPADSGARTLSDSFPALLFCLELRFFVRDRAVSVVKIGMFVPALGVCPWSSLPLGQF